MKNFNLYLTIDFFLKQAPKIFDHQNLKKVMDTDIGIYIIFLISYRFSLYLL